MNELIYLFAALACLAIGALAGYLAALSRRAAMAEQAAQLRSQVAALDATLTAERAAQIRLKDGRDLMADQFRVLANDILEEKSRRFTEQNQANLGQLLDPLKTRLQEFQSKVDQVYVQESKDRSALAQSLVVKRHASVDLAEARKSRRGQARGGVAVAEHLYIAAEWDHAEFPARSRAIPPAKQLRSETDRKHFDPHPIPARDYIVAELVDKHEHRENHHEPQDGIEQIVELG